MTTLKWDEERLYETGIDRGVLYLEGNAVPWNGLTSSTEKIPGGEFQNIYFDGAAVKSVIANEDFEVLLTAITYPDEFPESGRFGLSYRVKNGDGYKIHIIYNATAIPTEEVWASESDRVMLTNFKWDLATIPTDIPGFKSSAHLIVDSNIAIPEALADLEEALYGTVSTDATLPTAEEVVAIFAPYVTLTITDHGDGTWTASGPDDVVYLTDSTTFEINWYSAIFIDSVSYQVSTF